MKTFFFKRKHDIRLKYNKQGMLFDDAWIFDVLSTPQALWRYFILRAFQPWVWDITVGEFPASGGVGINSFRLSNRASWVAQTPFWAGPPIFGNPSLRVHLNLPERSYWLAAPGSPLLSDRSVREEWDNTEMYLETRTEFLAGWQYDGG